MHDVDVTESSIGFGQMYSGMAMTDLLIELSQLLSSAMGSCIVL